MKSTKKFGDDDLSGKLVRVMTCSAPENEHHHGNSVRCVCVSGLLGKTVRLGDRIAGSSAYKIRGATTVFCGRVVDMRVRAGEVEVVPEARQTWLSRIRMIFRGIPELRVSIGE